MIDSLFHAQTHAQQQAGPKKITHRNRILFFVSFFSTFNSKSVTLIFQVTHLRRSQLLYAPTLKLSIILRMRGRKDP